MRLSVLPRAVESILKESFWPRAPKGQVGDKVIDKRMCPPWVEYNLESTVSFSF